MNSDLSPVQTTEMSAYEYLCQNALDDEDAEVTPTSVLLLYRKLKEKEQVEKVKIESKLVAAWFKSNFSVREVETERFATKKHCIEDLTNACHFTA